MKKTKFYEEEEKEEENDDEIPMGELTRKKKKMLVYTHGRKRNVAFSYLSKFFKVQNLSLLVLKVWRSESCFLSFFLFFDTLKVVNTHWKKQSIISLSSKCQLAVAGTVSYSPFFNY